MLKEKSLLFTQKGYVELWCDFIGKGRYSYIPILMSFFLISFSSWGQGYYPGGLSNNSFNVWMDASDSSGISYGVGYVSSGFTATGTAGNSTVTVNTTPNNLAVGQVIRFGTLTTDYTIQSINGTTITLTNALSSSITAQSINVRTENLVSQWNDKSGKGLHALQGTVNSQPIYTTVNGKKIVDFNGIKFLSIADNNFLDPSNGYNLAQVVFVYQDAPTNVTDFRCGTFTRNSGSLNTPTLAIRYQTTDLKYEACLSYNSSASFIRTAPDLRNRFSLVENYVPTGYTRMFTMLNGGLSVNAAAAYTNNTTAASIGNRTGFPAAVHWGISETVLTSNAIGNSGRKILESYLAWKWNNQANLSSTVLNLFNPNNVNYAKNIVGIGKEGGTDSVNTTYTNDGLGFNNINDGTGFLKDSGDYVLAGHNGLTGTSAISNQFTRCNRVWYVSKTDVGTTGGNLQLFFNTSLLNLSIDTAQRNYYVLFNGTDSLFGTGVNGFLNVSAWNFNNNQITFTVNSNDLITGYYTLVSAPKTITPYSTLPYYPAGFLRSRFNLWFDASDNATVTIGNGLITKWTDKINGLEALPAATGYNPVLTTLLGRSIVEFNGLKALNIADNPLLDPNNGYHLAQTVFVYNDAPLTVADFRNGTYTRNNSTSNTPQIGIRYFTTDGKYELNLTRNNTGYNINNQADLRNRWSLVQNHVPLGYQNMYSTLNGGSRVDDTARFIDFNVPVSLGNRYQFPTNVHWGIGETILTGSDIGVAGGKILGSYLAWKWGTQSTLSAPQLALFNPSDSNYNKSIIGIGTNGVGDTLNATLTHDGLIIENINNFTGFLKEQGDYLIAGHNGLIGNTAMNAFFTRWNRAWYIQKTDANGLGGNVNLSFNFDEYGSTALLDQLSKTYYILFNPTNGNFSSGNNYIVPIKNYQIAQNANQINFSLDAINLSNGYYTIVWGNNEKSVSFLPNYAPLNAINPVVSPAPFLTEIVAGNTINYLSWNTDSIHYAINKLKLYVSINGGTFGLLDSFSANKKSFAHYNLTNGTSYTYKLTAEYAAGKESVFSNSLTGVPGVKTPIWSAKPMYAGNGQVVMKADSKINNLPIQYYFEAVSGGGHSSVYQSNQIYTDSLLTNGNTYSFRYKYKDSIVGVSSESGWSSTEMVTLYDSAKGGFTYNLSFLDPTTIDAPNGIYPSNVNPLQIDTTGLRFIKHAPAFGIHPRLYCNPEDSTDIKFRMLNTFSGRAVSKFIHATTVLLQLGASGYNRNASYNKDTIGTQFITNTGVDVKPIYDRLAVNDTTGYFNLWGGKTISMMYQLSFEAFECWLYRGTIDPVTNTSYTTRATKLGNVLLNWIRATLRDPNPAKALSYANRDRIGGHHFALVYDLIFSQLTANQKDTLRLALSRITSKQSELHGFSTPSYTYTSNWATFGYEIFPNLVIEGEPGYTSSADSAIKNWCRSTFNFFNHGMYAETGNFYEAIGKDQISGATLVLLAKRGYSFLGHPSVKSYGKKFLVGITQPFGYSYVGADLIGGTNAYSLANDDPSTGPYRFNASDIVGLKWSMPKDTAIDFVWKNYIQKLKTNQSVVPNYYSYTNFGPNLAYFNYHVPSAIFAQDYFSVPFTTQAQIANKNNKFYFDSLGGWATMRSGFDSAATALFFHQRQDLGGHTLPNKGNIMYSALGRIWIQSPGTSGNSQYNLVNTANSFTGILINGYGQPSDTTSSNANSNYRIAPSKVVAFKNSASMLSIAGDATEAYSYIWNEGLFTANQENDFLFVPGASKVMQSLNSFRYAKGYVFDNYSLYNRLSFYEGTRTEPIYDKFVRNPAPNVMEKVFRTVSLIPTAKPYILVADDVKKDNTINNYKWIAQMAKDLRITSTVVNLVDSNYRNDIIFSEPAGTGTRKLLVRVLNNTGAINPAIPGVTDSFNILSPRRLILESNSVEPQFKVLMFPYNPSDSLPKTKWNSSHDTLKVGFADSVKTFAFVVDGFGRTNINLVSTVSNQGFALRNKTSILEAEPVIERSGIAIYPNPVQGGRSITIQMKNMVSGVYNIQLYSSLGMVVKQIKLQHRGGMEHYAIPLPSSKGVYWINILGKDAKHYQKVVVQ